MKDWIDGVNDFTNINEDMVVDQTESHQLIEFDSDEREIRTF